MSETGISFYHLRRSSLSGKTGTGEDDQGHMFSLSVTLHQVLLADSVGLALLVVLETLAPPERLAFVLHDMFAVPFDEIASIVGRSPTAARQLASRARRRVRVAAPVPDADLTRQREVVGAFLAAARGGNFDALLAVLDPGVVLRADRGAVPAGATTVIRGATVVAERALMFSKLTGFARAALVNGAAGIVVFDTQGRPFSVIGFTVARERSSKSTFSPTTRASASSTWLSSPTDADKMNCSFARCGSGAVRLAAIK